MFPCVGTEHGTKKFLENSAQYIHDGTMQGLDCMYRCGAETEAIKVTADDKLCILLSPPDHIKISNLAIILKPDSEFDANLEMSPLRINYPKHMQVRRLRSLFNYRMASPHHLTDIRPMHWKDFMSNVDHTVELTKRMEDVCADP